MWLIAKGRLVRVRTTSMSRLMAAVAGNSVRVPPRPPAFDTAAASSADVQVPIGARMTGTSIPNKSHSGVFSIVSPRSLRRHARRRVHLVAAVRRRRRDRGAHHVTRLIAGPRPAAMHGGAVVPHDDVAALPFVLVGRAGRRRRGGEFLDQFFAR